MKTRRKKISKPALYWEEGIGHIEIFPSLKEARSVRRKRGGILFDHDELENEYLKNGYMEWDLFRKHNVHIGIHRVTGEIEICIRSKPNEINWLDPYVCLGGFDTSELDQQLIEKYQEIVETKIAELAEGTEFEYLDFEFYEAHDGEGGTIPPAELAKLLVDSAKERTERAIMKAIRPAQPLRDLSL